MVVDVEAVDQKGGATEAEAQFMGELAILGI